MECHSKAVNSLGVSADGENLVSASDDGSVRVWDLRSRQQLRAVHSPSKAPVSCALIVQWPDYLSGVGQGAAGERKGPKRPQPLAPLAKYPGAAGGLKAWEGAPIVLDGSSWSPNSIAVASGICGAPAAGSICVLSPELPELSTGPAEGAFGAEPMVEGNEAAGSQSTEAAALREEAQALRQQLQAANAAADEWRRMHGELHAMCIDQVTGK